MLQGFRRVFFYKTKKKKKKKSSKLYANEEILRVLQGVIVKATEKSKETCRAKHF